MTEPQPPDEVITKTAQNGHHFCRKAFGVFLKENVFQDRPETLNEQSCNQIFEFSTDSPSLLNGASICQDFYDAAAAALICRWREAAILKNEQETNERTQQPDRLPTNKAADSISRVI